MPFKESLPIGRRREAAEMATVGELERSSLRMLLHLIAGTFLLAALVLLAANILTRHYALAGVNLVGAVVAAACLVWARRSGRYRRPTQVLLGYIFLVAAIGTFQEGASLPAAAWWLFIVPLVLAAGGMFHTSIVSAVTMLVVVSLVDAAKDYGLQIPALQTSEWHRYITVVSSILLLLCTVVTFMLGRRAMVNMLETARRTASDAAAVKDQFMANMTHEIRTPLNGIVGAAELLASNRVDETQRAQLLELQHQSAQTLLALVNDVLDFSKLDAGRVVLERQKLDLRELVFAANELFSIQAFAKGIEITSSCSADLPEQFIGDPTRLRQILSNLVANAVKFTEQGGVHIHCGLVEHAGEGPASDGPQARWVQIDVEDTGPGIYKEAIGKLFKPFSQADAAITRKYGGTGLGLSIAQGLARLMGGGIMVESEPGRGSTFSLQVPLHASRRPPEGTEPVERSDIRIATESDGLRRHFENLCERLRIKPVLVDRLPTDEELRDCGILLIDTRMLLQMPDSRAWLAAQAALGRTVVLVAPLGSDCVVGAPSGVLVLYKPVSLHALADVLGTASEVHAARQTPSPATLSPMRVLVVEDNPVNQVIVQAMLGELGMESVIANDGVEGVERAIAEAFDLVLMDLQMPRMDGFTATRELRKTEAEKQRKRSLVVAMSAGTAEDLAPECRAAGMDAYLCKPFGMAHLRQCLEFAGRFVEPELKAVAGGFTSL